MFKGHAEYDTIREIKQQVSIPVIANGDVNCPQDAKEVLEYTGADGIMIGRAAQGNPWIFKQIEHYLATGKLLAKPSSRELAEISIKHVNEIYDLYGLHMGVRIARKHVGWYISPYDPNKEFRRHFNSLDESELQISALEDFFSLLPSQANNNANDAA